MALELRPNCDFCDQDLPAHATAARICSFVLRARAVIQCGRRRRANRQVTTLVYTTRFGSRTGGFSVAS